MGPFHLLILSAVFSFEISNVINPVLSTKVDEVDDRYVMRFVDRCSDDVCQLKMSVKARGLRLSDLSMHTGLYQRSADMCAGISPESESMFEVFRFAGRQME